MHLTDPRTPSRIARVLGPVAAVLLVAGGVVATTPPAAASPGRYVDPSFASVRTTDDLVYGRVRHDGAPDEKLRLDLYQPVGDPARRRAVVIFIHGGTSDVDKSARRNRMVARGFARRGFVAASIAYRSGTSGLSAESQEDTRAAVRWFRSRAARYRIAVSEISLLGSSAGAVNALQVAFNPEDAGHSGHPGFPSRVASAVAVSGTDYEAVEIGPDEVPIAMVHAADDTTIPIAAAQATCQQTQAMGNRCRFFEYAEGGHPPDFLIEHKPEITEQVSGFICRQVLHHVRCAD